MSADDMEYSEIGGDESQLVPAVFARDAEEAQRYCELLADHGIIGIVAADGVDVEGAADEIEEPDSDEVPDDVGQGVGMTRGVAVLVEDALLDEAGMVISDRDDPAEFQFGEDEEEDDEDDDELDFAQGIDSEFEDDAGPVNLDIFSGGEGPISGHPADDDDDDIDFDDNFDDDFDDEFDVS